MGGAACRLCCMHNSLAVASFRWGERPAGRAHRCSSSAPVADNKTIMKRILILAVALSVGGCATYYTAPNFGAVKRRDKTIAILPVDVTVGLMNLPNGSTAKYVKAQERDQAYALQRLMFAVFRDSNERYSVKFQPVETTDALLERHHIGYEDLSAHTKQELASLLGVDAVISTFVTESHPEKTGAAIASLILLKAAARTVVSMTLMIHEAADGRLSWSYNGTSTEPLGSSPETGAKHVMQRVARDFPFDLPE